MNIITIYFALVLVGLCMGSFAGASVWRLRARDLESDKQSGEVYDKDEYKRLHKLTSSSTLNDRSRCLECSYTLQWYDLVPLFSWLALGGKCRKCRRPIGWMEPIIELSVAAFFVLSFAFWPFGLADWAQISRFAIWMVAGVALAIQFAYDFKWFLLPTKVANFIIGLGVINTILIVIKSNDIGGALATILGSVLILSGLYWSLNKISNGKWIGYGDVKLGLGLALLLADWQLAFIALFAANIIGCLLVLPGLLTHRLKRDTHIPFGPLLIVGFVIAGLFGTSILNAYLSLLV